MDNHPDSSTLTRSRLPSCFKCGKQESPMTLLETSIFTLTSLVSDKYWVHNKRPESTHVVALCKECKNVEVR